MLSCSFSYTAFAFSPCASERYKETRRAYRRDLNQNSSAAMKHHELAAQNQSLLYATHQLAYAIGIVAKRAHQKGSARSATKPNPPNVSQKIFFCTIQF
jgi:hypothetical protein